MTRAPAPIKTLLASAFLGWLISSFPLFVFFKLSADQSNHPSAYEVVAIGIMMIAYALLPTLIAAALLGPVWLTHAAKRGLRSKWSYILAGLMIGAGVGAFMCAAYLWLLGVAWWALALFGVPYSAAIGALGGLFVWMDLRPDRDGPNPPTPAP